MLSVDESVDEPWGDVPYLQPRVHRIRGLWFERVLAALTVLAGAIGAVGALRLGAENDAGAENETSRRG
jgi:hypothetical protein